MEQIDDIKRLVETNSDDMQFVTTAAGIEDAFANGKVASLIGLESGHGLGLKLYAFSLQKMRRLTILFAYTWPKVGIARAIPVTLPLPTGLLLKDLVH